MDHPGTSCPSTLDGPARPMSVHLHSLLTLLMRMVDARDEVEILRLAAVSIPALSRCHTEATYLVHKGTLVSLSATAPTVERQVDALAGRSGPITFPDEPWAWAYPLRNKEHNHGYLVVSSPQEPSSDDRFLLEVLLRETGSALASAKLGQDARQEVIELQSITDNQARVNDQLNMAVADLDWQMRAHDVLSAASASAGGETALAAAMHSLTGLSVAIEDRFGNLLAWAGPDCPDPYPKLDDRKRAQTLRRAASDHRPIRDRNRLIALAQPQNEILGLIALVDPTHSAGRLEQSALQYSATFLAMDLAHRRALAEIEQRLRRELVDDLLTGSADESAYERAAAVGHDLHGPHYVVSIRWREPAGRTQLVDAVGAAASTLTLKPLQAWRSGVVILLVHAPLSGDELYKAVSKEIGPDGAIGIGGRCDALADFPQSLQQSLKSLEIRQSSRQPYGATTFDQLGLYRILGTDRSSNDVKAFIREWLGPLLDYDAKRHTGLVETLSQYLDCGGNYDHAAQTLLIHRSTLRYRLRRIREITQLDLTEVDIRLNLHVATRACRILNEAS